MGIFGSLVGVKPCFYVWPLVYGRVELLQVLCGLFIEDFGALDQVSVNDMKHAKICPRQLLFDKHQLSSLLVVFFQERFEEIQPFWKTFVLVVIDERLCFVFLLQIASVCVDCMPRA